YWRDDKTHDLIGINKEVASAIQVIFEDEEIRSIEYQQNPEGTTYKPNNLPKNARKLKGFIWRGDERILSKAQLFENDPPLDLPKIKGIPLPDSTRFFEERDADPRPLLNEKSRLNPEILQTKERQ